MHILDWFSIDDRPNNDRTFTYLITNNEHKLNKLKYWLIILVPAIVLHTLPTIRFNYLSV